MARRWAEYNLSEGDVRGGQVSGVFNIAESSKWFQGAGVFNINDSLVHGFQAAGVINVAGRRLDGAQAAGVVNIIGGSLNGLQTSGVLNIAGDVRGVQLGLVNIGDEVRGSQIGLVNISSAMYGVPLGLINISGNGLFDPVVWSDDTGFTYAGLQMGAGFLYTLLYAGAPFMDPLSSLSFGVGMGIHANFRPFYLDIDASVKSSGSGADVGLAIQDSARAFGVFPDMLGVEPVRMYPIVRATLGFTIFRYIAVFGGMGLEAHAPGITEKNAYFHSGDPWVLTGWNAPDGAVELYPRWFFGVRI